MTANQGSPTCPEAEFHGKPFRYCPVKGCGWMEPPDPEEVAYKRDLGEARAMLTDFANMLETTPYIHYQGDVVEAIRLLVAATSQGSRT